MRQAAPMPPGPPGGSFAWQAGAFRDDNEQGAPAC